MIVTVDTEKVAQLTKDGEAILFTPEAESTLLELLDLKAQIEQAYDDLRHRIEETALELNPNFKAVVGDKVRVQYRYFGAKYKLTPGLEHELAESNPDLVNERTSYTINSKALEAYEKEHGEVPYGVSIAERQKQIVIKRTEEDDDGEESL